MAQTVSAAQTGSSGVPVQRAMQVPSTPSTSQHMAPRRQSSLPALPPCGAVQGSPGCWSPVTGTHLVPVQEESAPQAVHFSPRGQSWANTSHRVCCSGPRSGGQPA